MTKIIIAGGRDFIVKPEHIDLIDEKLKKLDINYQDIEFVTGMAKGADQIPYFYQSMGYNIKEFPANWEKYGKGAGHIRNKQMAEYGDILIAFWNGFSRGTGNMLTVAKAYNLKIIKVLYD